MPIEPSLIVALGNYISSRGKFDEASCDEALLVEFYNQWMDNDKKFVDTNIPLFVLNYLNPRISQLLNNIKKLDEFLLDTHQKLQ